MPKAYDSAPNAINQDQVSFIFQDLKQTEPRIWQAITSLKSFPPPMPFYYEMVLQGKQNVKTNVLSYAPILRIPTDPYGVWDVPSVILQEVEISCVVKPGTTDFVADILITRNRRAAYFSIFNSNSTKAILKKGGDYSKQIGVAELGTTELFDGDEFRVDVLSADGTVSGIWIALRGYYNLRKLKRQQ